MSSFEFDFKLVGIDEVSTILNNVGYGISKVTDSVEANTKASAAAEASTTDMLLATNNLASGCASLVSSVLNVERAEYMVEKAHLAVQRATENLEKAQNAYNITVEKYGEGSKQAREAADKLAIAQEALNVAQDRAGIVQNSLNQSMLSAALNVIPTLISVVTSATTIITNLTGVVDMASLAMDAIPFVAVAAGAIAVGVAIYSWVSANNAAAQAQREFDQMLSAHDDLMNRSIVTWDELGKAILDNEENLRKLHAKFDEITKKEIEQTGAASNIITMFGGLGFSTDQLKQGLDKLTSGYEKDKTAIDGATTAGEELGKQLQESQSIHELYFSTVTQKMDAYKASVSDMADKFKTDFAGMTMAQVADSDVMKLDIQALADQYHVSWIEMYDDVKTSIDNSEKAMADLTSSLEEKFNLQKAAASDALPFMARQFDEAFNSGRLEWCKFFVDSFAKQFDISIPKAEAMLEGFKAKIAEIPEMLDQKLVREAQSKFEAFQRCVSGKALTLNTDVVGAMRGMSDSIVDCINKGLVGEAQNEMASYVACSTNKMGDMVLKVTGYMNDMVDKSGAKWDAFNSWLKALFAQMLTNAGSLQAGIDTVVTSAASALQKVSSDSAAAHAILSDMWTTTQSMEALWRAQQGILAAAAVAEVGHIPTPGGPTPEAAEGGIFTEPTLVLVGEKGPEAVVPLSRGGSTPMSGPTVNIYISDSLIDKPMVDFIKRQVFKALETVIVEPTSVSVPTTQKRIRQGAAFT